MDEPHPFGLIHGCLKGPHTTLAPLLFPLVLIICELAPLLRVVDGTFNRQALLLILILVKPFWITELVVPQLMKIVEFGPLTLLAHLQLPLTIMPLIFSHPPCPPLNWNLVWKSRLPAKIRFHFVGGKNHPSNQDLPRGKSNVFISPNYTLPRFKSNIW